MKLTPVIAGLASVALLGAPASAHAAKAATLKGQVVGQAYKAKKRIAVPVLLDQRSAKRARLKSPLGVLLLPKKKVKVKGQRARVAPELLRIGDRMRARARLSRTARRAAYWRTPTRSFKVTKRSATLGAAELQALFGTLGGDLRELEAALTGLAKYVQAGFVALDGDMDALRGDLGALGTALQALEQRVAALEAGLPGLESRLQAQIDTLASDLAALGTQVGALETQVASLQSQLGALGGDISSLEDDVAALQTAVAGLATDVGELQTAVGALCGPASPLNALC